ncbi:MAG TPA: 2-oxoacid:acceptor oxidoreductase [Clostridiales bacterium]|jgi:2-oxoglutarate ferredoxin oxidoreductase subunit delta|nr:2-oxoacid:acceptor oxidoreductase [Clostridiales bacterium]
MAKIEVNKELCKSCGLCVAQCPLGLIFIGSAMNDMGYAYAVQEDAEKCTGCTLCAVMCPDAAIEVYR